MAGGRGGCPPHKTKLGACPPLLSPRYEWDLKRRQTLSLRGWAKGVQGAKPPWRGAVGVSPHKFKRGGELPH